MDNTVPAPERAARKALSADLPSGWVEVQEGLAAASGLALLTVEGRQPPSLAVSNNNSICRAFQTSNTHSYLCESDCGEAYFRANEAGEAVHYRCHAGLQCFAAPVQIGGKKTRAVIGGRCFLRVADYRALAERIRAGDLSDLLSADLFANVIFASRQDLEDLAARVEESAHAFAGSHSKTKETEGEMPASKAQAVYVNGFHKVEAHETADAKGETPVEASETAPQGGAKAAARGKASKPDASMAEVKSSEAVTDEAVTNEAVTDEAVTNEAVTDEAVTDEAIETVEASAEVSTRADAKTDEALKTGARAHAQTRAGGAAQGGSLEETCRRAVGVLTRDYGVESLALLLRADDSFYATCVTGQFERRPPRVTLKPKEIKLLLAATGDESIAVPAGGRTSSKHEDAVELFPFTVGEEIKGALLVGDSGLEDEQRRAIASFCRDLSMPLELLRLREELDRRARAASQLRAFTEVVNSAQPDDAYTTILRHSAELLHAERGSLLLFDERAGELSVKAAVGPRADVARDARVALGEGVAGTVMREGRPAVVRDVSKVAGLRPAPDERRYKTRSFISYPIVIAGRKVGVLNMTDKAGGGDYDESDLGLLDLIAPQMALALDRVEWHSKATQFQLLSITDPLTGLVNRRYLEERLQEELERSKRHRFAMSFLMVDIDDFKNYNDQHGHQAGDLALEMTAQCLKTALRSADVAARYGGEEFSILLPQTSLSEGRVIAERIRRRIERTQFPHGKAQPLGAVTISIGISSFGPETDTPSSVIYAADRALYAAKSRGKNCSEAFEPKKPASEGEDEKGEGKS